MLNRLLDYVLAASDKDLSTLLIQDMAICWIAANLSGAIPGDDSRRKALGMRVDCWKQQSIPRMPISLPRSYASLRTVMAPSAGWWAAFTRSRIAIGKLAPGSMWPAAILIRMTRFWFRF